MTFELNQWMDLDLTEELGKIAERGRNMGSDLRISSFMAACAASNDFLPPSLVKYGRSNYIHYQITELQIWGERDELVHQGLRNVFVLAERYQAEDSKNMHLISPFALVAAYRFRTFAAGNMPCNFYSPARSCSYSSTGLSPIFSNPHQSIIWEPLGTTSKTGISVTGGIRSATRWSYKTSSHPTSTKCVGATTTHVSPLPCTIVIQIFCLFTLLFPLSFSIWNGSSASLVDNDGGCPYFSHLLFLLNFVLPTKDLPVLPDV